MERKEEEEMLLGETNSLVLAGSVEPSPAEWALSAGAGGCGSQQAPYAEASREGQASWSGGWGVRGGWQPGAVGEKPPVWMVSLSLGVQLKGALVFWVAEVSEKCCMGHRGCLATVFLWDQ